MRALLAIMTSVALTMASTSSPTLIFKSWMDSFEIKAVISVGSSP